MLQNADIDENKLKRQKAAVIKFLYWLMIFGCGFFSLKYLLSPLMPFMLAYFISWLLDKPISYIHRKTKLPRGVVASVFVVLFALLGGGVLTLLGISLINNARSVIAIFPDIMQNDVIPFLNEFLDGVEDFVSVFDPQGGEVLQNVMTTMFKVVNESTLALCSSAITFLGVLLAKIPSVLFKTIITIIASIFISTDFQVVKGFLLNLIPPAGRAFLNEGTQFFGKTVVKCAFAYVIILSMTFVELWLGLGIIGTKNSAIIALVIAILDILPVLGTGTILIPWAVISLLMGKFTNGVCILGLYVIITAVRNMIEPKLVGKQMKLHPVLTLAGMLIGMRFFGFLGMLGVPLTMSFIKRLSDQGLIHLWFLNKERKSEPDK